MRKYYLSVPKWSEFGESLNVLDVVGTLGVGVGVSVDGTWFLKCLR